MFITIEKGITSKEVDEIKKMEEARYAESGQELGNLVLELSDDEKEIIVQSSPKSNIKRVRRITGYLSNVENFNDAKREELNDRVMHNEVE